MAPTDSTVLLSGESGTGKEVVARYIHSLSDRADGMFHSLTCGALPESLLESELFGHVKGSFTGAVKDKQGLLEVLDSGHWSYNGPKECQFNRAFAEFVGTEYAVSVANGTVSLQLALEACAVGWGHEVILPGLTWQATAGAVLDVNAVPILVDVCPDTWCIDPACIEAAITPRTKAIIPVHLYGSFADMDAIMPLAQQHGLRVIEDCAHKHGGQ